MSILGQRGTVAGVTTTEIAWHYVHCVAQICHHLQALPGLLKRKAGCFLEWELVRPWPPSSLGPQRHRFGVMSNAGGTKELRPLTCPVPSAGLQGPSSPAADCGLLLSVWTIQKSSWPQTGSVPIRGTSLDSETTCWAKRRGLGLFGGAWVCSSLFKVFL